MPQFNIDHLDDDLKQKLRLEVEDTARAMLSLYRSEGHPVEVRQSLEAYHKILNLDHGSEFDAGYIMGCMNSLQVLFGSEGRQFVGNIMLKIK